MGPMGVGKSTLFNRLTNSNTRTSVSTESCTTKNSTANAIGPAKDLLIIDTPGTAASTTHGMTVEQAFQLRKALTTGDVSQIVVVIAATNNPRAQSYCDQLYPLKEIFDCNTFRQDVNGCDVVLQTSKWSPHRTRVFVVVTHRDRMEMSHRVQMRGIVDKIREDNPWVGPVAFIDKDVDIGWIYNTIIASAGFEGSNNTNYQIPLCEMFCNFRISFPELKDEWNKIVEDAKSKLDIARQCIHSQLSTVEAIQYTEQVGGFHVDHVAPTLDCLLKFIDDIYEETTHHALAEIFKTSVDELWTDTNEDILIEKVNIMNAIKKHLSQPVMESRKYVINKFPSHGESAVYKKCPYCGAVYMKPTGCNYLGKCGLKAGVNKGAFHSGNMNLSMHYFYDFQGNVKNALKIVEGKNQSVLEMAVMKIRRNFHKIVQRLPINHRSEYHDESESPADLRGPEEGGLKEYGCGKDLTWNTMKALTLEELKSYELVPNNSKIQFEPVEDITSMTIETFLLQKCGKSYKEYIQIFKGSGIDKLSDLIEAHRNIGDEMFNGIVENRLHKFNIVRQMKIYTN